MSLFCILLSEKAIVARSCPIQPAIVNCHGAKNILIVSADAIRMSADSLIVFSNAIRIFLASFIVLKIRVLQSVFFFDASMDGRCILIFSSDEKWSIHAVELVLLLLFLSLLLCWLNKTDYHKNFVPLRHNGTRYI